MPGSFRPGNQRSRGRPGAVDAPKVPRSRRRRQCRGSAPTAGNTTATLAVAGAMAIGFFDHAARSWPGGDGSRHRQCHPPAMAGQSQNQPGRRRWPGPDTNYRATNLHAAVEQPPPPRARVPTAVKKKEPDEPAPMERVASEASPLRRKGRGRELPLDEKRSGDREGQSKEKPPMDMAPATCFCCNCPPNGAKATRANKNKQENAEGRRHQRRGKKS